MPLNTKVFTSKLAVPPAFSEVSESACWQVSSGFGLTTTGVWAFNHVTHTIPRTVAARKRRGGQRSLPVPLLANFSAARKDSAWRNRSRQVLLNLES